MKFLLKKIITNYVNHIYNTNGVSGICNLDNNNSNTNDKTISRESIIYSGNPPYVKIEINGLNIYQIEYLIEMSNKESKYYSYLWWDEVLLGRKLFKKKAY